MPEPVRQRAVALAADALGRLPVDVLPASLRRVASFAPARRAKSAASLIAAELENDEPFRERVAAQVRVARPQLTSALESDGPPPAADPIEVAAVAYLLRTPDWKATVEAADSAQTTDSTASQARAIERLERQLGQARAEVRSARERGRQQVEQLKRDNSELRRKLAEARARRKDAEAQVGGAKSEREKATEQVASLEAEIRRLRARVTELEASSTAVRRAVRDEREWATVRQRLLLDTMLDVVQGLRRELALPPAEGAPADAVEGAVTPTARTAATAAQARPTDDPELLAELLALPRVHMIVDGYNVTKTAWPSAPLEQQRDRLLRGLGPLAARNRPELTVVFDGAELSAPPPVSGPRGVRVMFSPSQSTADDVIRELLAAEPTGRPIVVVSSDREVADAASARAARPIEAIALVRLLTRD